MKDIDHLATPLRNDRPCQSYKMGWYKYSHIDSLTSFFYPFMPNIEKEKTKKVCADEPKGE